MWSNVDKCGLLFHFFPQDHSLRYGLDNDEEAYNRLEAQGKPFGSITLAREAHVGDHATSSFLKEQRRKSHAEA